MMKGGKTKMKTLQKIALGIGAGVLALTAGTSYAGAKEDLEAVRSYVQAHPTITGTIGNAQLYGLRTGNILTQTSGKSIWFQLTGKNRVYFFCDNNGDGKLDGFAYADNKADQSFAEMDCLSGEGRVSSKKQELYEGIVGRVLKKLSQ